MCVAIAWVVATDLDVTCCLAQTCVSAKRVLVQRALFKAFREKLVSKVNSLVLGDPSLASTHIGPLVSERQMNAVLQLIETAKPQGASILCGGQRSIRPGCEKGWFVEPTIIVDVQPHMTCFQEEIFGPCITLLSFDDEERPPAHT